MTCRHLLLGALLAMAGCGPAMDERGSTGGSSAPAPPEIAIAPEAAPPAPERVPSLVLLAGGDVSFSRDLGQTLLREPEHDFFGPIAKLLVRADLRFVNLEGPLSEQGGVTQSPWNALTFTGPPGGADALARAGIDVVSTANNHAWDYGERALRETLDNLDRAGVRHAGTGGDLRAAEEPVVVEKNGLHVGFVAVTDVWNLGSLRTHKAAEFVARADRDRLVAAVRGLRARGDVDLIVVSYHGGVEYLDLPLSRTREIARAAVDAGADLVIGHHPHVLQGVEWRGDRPILYSLGNLIMRMSQTEKKPTGYLARVTFTRGQPPRLEACPLAIRGITPRRLADEPDARRRAALEHRFFDHLDRISRDLGGASAAEPGDDGCAELTRRP